MGLHGKLNKQPTWVWVSQHPELQHTWSMCELSCVTSPEMAEPPEEWFSCVLETHGGAIRFADAALTGGSETVGSCLGRAGICKHRNEGSASLKLLPDSLGMWSISSFWGDESLTSHWYFVMLFDLDFCHLLQMGLTIC